MGDSVDNKHNLTTLLTVNGNPCFIRLYFKIGGTRFYAFGHFPHLMCIKFNCLLNVFPCTSDYPIIGIG